MMHYMHAHVKAHLDQRLQIGFDLLFYEHFCSEVLPPERGSSYYLVFFSLNLCTFSSEQCFFSPSLESGYLSCSFDDGLCGWIRDKDGDVHWETTPDPSGNWRNACLFQGYEEKKSINNITQMQTHTHTV